MGRKRKTMEEQEDTLASRGRPSLKRFKQGLTPGAIRSRQGLDFDSICELAPTGQALCKVCSEKITKGAPRVALLLQCHLGYKDLSGSLTHRCHVECLSRHPEAVRLESIEEITMKELLDPASRGQLERQFALILERRALGEHLLGQVAYAAQPAKRGLKARTAAAVDRDIQEKREKDEEQNDHHTAVVMVQDDFMQSDHHKDPFKASELAAEGALRAIEAIRHIA
jgi:hypothetical protein